MCHPKFKPGPPSDEAQVLSERLFETLASYVIQVFRNFHPLTLSQIEFRTTTVSRDTSRESCMDTLRRCNVYKL